MTEEFLPNSEAVSQRAVIIAVVGLMVLSVAALAIALAAPLGVTVIGLLLFGVLHNYFELRYVLGRYAMHLPRRFLLTAGALITLIVLRRLLVIDSWGENAEILLAYGLLAAALSWASSPRSLVFWLGMLIIAGAAGWSLTDPPLHFVVLSHLHNLVPLAFLWLWSSSIASAWTRRAFRLANVVWSLLIPAVILTGALDQVLPPNLALGSALAGDAMGLARSYTPALWHEGAMPLRMLTAFAFLQTMHHVVWCGFFPRIDHEAGRRVERTLDARGLPTGRWLMTLVLAVAVLIAAAMLVDYFRGRSLYAALASYHAYIEFPILLLGLIALLHRQSRTATPTGDQSGTWVWRRRWSTVR